MQHTFKEDFTAHLYPSKCPTMLYIYIHLLHSLQANIPLNFAYNY